MKNLTFIFIILLSLTQNVIADDKKFGDIPEELLKATVHPLDSAAHASYYQKNVKVYYNFNVPNKLTLESEYHYIIKIYSEEGEDYANFEIPFYQKSSSNKEKVSDIKAVAVNIENGKIVKTKLSKKDIYKEKTSENWQVTKFAVPNVKAGTVIEVKYTFTTPYIRTIPKWYFQNYIPTDESIYRIKVPEYFVLTPVPTGAVQLDMQQDRISTSRHGEVEYVITGRDIPCIKEDKYVLNENDYRSGIKYEIQSTRFPNGQVENYAQNWSQIAMDLMKAKYFGDQINKKIKELKPVVAEAESLERMDKIKYFYDHVRTNYTWNEKYGLGSYDGLKDVVKNKSGSAGDLNILLLNLLKAGGIESNGFAISSRSNGIINTNYPALSSLDYLLVHVKTDTDFILMDASSKFSPIGELPVRATNINGILIDKTGAKVVELDYDNNFKVQTLSQYTVDLENNKLIGTSQRKRTGYAATNFRIKAEEQKADEENQESEEDYDEEGQDEDIESYDLENSYDVTELKNFEDIYEPIGIEYSEELNTVMKQVGDKVFLNATLDFGIKKNPFEEDQRSFPVFYNYKIHSQSIAAVEVPEGYYVEQLPKTVRATLPNKMGTFSYDTSVKTNKVNINYKFKINETVILPQDYPALKKIYDMVIATYNEKIIFSKGEKPKDVTITN